MFDEIDLDEICDLLERAQELNHKASTNQDTLFSGFPDAEGPIAVCQISDWRIASYGTDHQYARRFLQEIESVPDLYLVIVGDMQNMQVNLSQGVAACSDNILTPAMQHKVLEAWLSRVAARTLASTWDNHAVEREEKGTGASLAAHVFSERVPYFNGIGHWDLVVGPETYKIAISHKFRGRSDNNPCMGGMKYLRFHANNREIAMCGDSHVPDCCAGTRAARTASPSILARSRPAATASGTSASLPTRSSPSFSSSPTGTWPSPTGVSRNGSPPAVACNSGHCGINTRSGKPGWVFFAENIMPKVNGSGARRSVPLRSLTKSERPSLRKGWPLPLLPRVLLSR
jgi:hypothetical protein